MAIQPTYKITVKNPEVQAIIRKALEDKEKVFATSNHPSVEELRKKIANKK